jgi:creatinine amidohydrolase
MKKVWLDEMTWEESEEAFKKTDIAVICCGATHPHGLACPLGTDTFVADGMGERIGKKSNVIVVPTITYGYNQYHMDFPGCINISKDHLRDLYLDICESLYKWGIRKLVFLSPHGGNVSVIEDVAYRLRYEKGILSALVSYELAGEVDTDLQGYPSEGLADETSMMLYLRPDTAHPERAKFKGYKNTFGPRLKVDGWKTVKFGKGHIRLFTTSKDISDSCEFVVSSSDISKAGNMASATRKLGERIIETAVDYIVEFIEEFRKVGRPIVT